MPRVRVVRRFPVSRRTPPLLSECSKRPHPEALIRTLAFQNRDSNISRCIIGHSVSGYSLPHLSRRYDHLPSLTLGPKRENVPHSCCCLDLGIIRYIGAQLCLAEETQNFLSAAPTSGSLESMMFETKNVAELGKCQR